jgi:hypothetical protein
MNMRYSLWMFLLATASLAQAGPDVRSLGLFYDNSFTHIESYQHPGALLITGNCNPQAPQFAAARAAGAEVLRYLNPVDVYDHMPCKLSSAFYDGGKAPLWSTPQGDRRINYPKTHLADIRANSEWSNHVVAFVEGLMRDESLDGVFLDVVGARLWGKPADWKQWSPAEQDAWTQGCVDLVRRIDQRRRALNPKFIVVTNGLWDRGDARGLEGERYVDGIMLEHPQRDVRHEEYARRPYGDLGHRRLLVIARSPEEAAAWSQVPGVTHISYQAKYDHPDD